jgi:hypothetical protein
MDYPDSLRSRMFQWYDVPLSVTNRLVPKVKDVSPCSEYTRYTVEGVFKDPYNELSALLDVHSLGPIFVNSDLKDPKWSSKLGYGMAVVGEDTRIHLHRNGKYIIRRARDREHAESTYQRIVHLMKPVLFDETSDRFFWDILKEALAGDVEPESIGALLRWPSEEGDVRSILRSIRVGVSEIDEKLLSRIRTDLLEGDTIDIEGYKNTLNVLLIETSKKMPEDADISLGRYCALLWALRSLEIIDDTAINEFNKLEDWDLDKLTERSNGIEETNIKVNIFRIHYLLYPVPSG